MLIISCIAEKSPLPAEDFHLLLWHPVLVQKMTALISSGKAKAQGLTTAVFEAQRHYTAVIRFRFILIFLLP